jgi:hypothetical protein
MRVRIWLVALATIAGGAAAAADPPAPREKHFLADPDVFPIAVWVQSPARAADYKAIGINLYVGLWRGPTEAQLTDLKRHGMRVVCSQNEVGLKHLDDPTIVAWMHGDEPDNARSLGRGKGYGPPILPAKVVEDYERIKKADPSRPVLLNLGQGVAWDKWVGRGTRTNHPEDYPEYLKGCDIASFDIYPVSHEKEEIAGKLWYVPQGVDRLRRWSEGKKDVWCCIETTGIDNPDRRPTPQNVRSEVWMALVHGARGIIYFAHEFKPKFVEAGLLADEEMARGVAAINRRIHELAPVLNSPDVTDGASVASSEERVPIDFVVKRHAGKTYLFAVAMRQGDVTASFTLPGTGDARVEVLGEGRTIEAVGGRWEDRFKGYQVHLYKIAPRPPG